MMMMTQYVLVLVLAALVAVEAHDPLPPGAGGAGVQAVTERRGPNSGKADDAISDVTCLPDEVLVSCRCDDGNECDGAQVSLNSI